VVAAAVSERPVTRVTSSGPAVAEAGRAAVFYFVNEAPTSRAARMDAAAEAAEQRGDHAAAAQWRARAVAQHALAARLPHGGRPNIEWQVRAGNGARSRVREHGRGLGGVETRW
jgi:hypothetical protein